ncbi:MAG TPA: response regulator [Bdellovibrionales bacterium]|nr:response regulator [Bdellovibrionales bacterium]
MSVRILVADDAAFIREVLTQIIAKAGFELVGEASDGAEAIEIALREKPDVIIMDIVMPNKSGIQATQEILEKLPRTRIIACTTEGQESMVFKALEAGCCDYVTKPFKVQQIIDLIRNSAAKGATLG